MGKGRRRVDLKGNDVRLRDVPEGILRLAGHFVTSEVESCDDGMLPEERAAYVALSNTVRDELRRRGKKIGFALPAPLPEKGEAR